MDTEKDGENLYVVMDYIAFFTIFIMAFGFMHSIVTNECFEPFPTGTAYKYVKVDNIDNLPHSFIKLPGYKYNIIEMNGNLYWVRRDEFSRQKLGPELTDEEIEALNLIKANE